MTTVESAVRVELLLVPECPHAGAARTLLATSLAQLGLGGVQVTETVGEFASPTIVVDGVDVMTGVPPVSGASCRLDMPTAQQVLSALSAAARGAAVTGGAYPAQLAVGVTSSRIAEVSPPARMLHKAILRGFATTGSAPAMAELAAEVPAGHELEVLLAELHDHDVIRLGEHGQIRAAYPFSVVPTDHVVAIDGGPAVFAMCAIDALGMGDMLGRDITIASRDPQSGQDITVTIHDGQLSREPATVVVYVCSDGTATATATGCCAPDSGDTSVAAADRCCGVMNFFASPETAHTWISAHPNVQGQLLTKEQAYRLGVDIFGRLLHDQLPPA